MSRKTNSNAWETDLSGEQQWQAFEALGTLGYAKGALWIAKEFGIDAPSLAACNRFYHDMLSRKAEADTLRIVADTEFIGRMAEQVGDVSPAMLAKLDHAAFAALSTGDPEQIKLLVGLALKAREQKRQEAEFEQKVAEFRERVKSATDKALDALFEEVRGDAVAEDLFRKFSERVRKARDAA